MIISPADSDNLQEAVNEADGIGQVMQTVRITKAQCTAEETPEKSTPKKSTPKKNAPAAPAGIVKTGDYFDRFDWVMLLTIAGLSAILVIGKRRRAD